MALPLFLVAVASWWDMTPELVREKIDQRIMSIEAPVPYVLRVEDGKVQNVPIRTYVPSQQIADCAILFIHGGAFVAGSLDTHDNMARYLASKTNCEVVAVGYTLSPQAKYPQALEECYSVMIWLSSKFQKLIVVGDSAGGNLAASLCILSRDKNGPRPLLQVLINPATDLTVDVAETPWQAHQYLSDPQEATLPYVSPLKAKELNNLPPALIILAELDELRPSGKAYADRLKSAHVPTQVFCQSNIGHLAGDAARASLRAQPSLDAAVAHIKSVLQN